MTEAEKERAAVVAWLRNRAAFYDRKSKTQKQSYYGEAYETLWRTTKGSADAIERGHHLQTPTE